MATAGVGVRLGRFAQPEQAEEKKDNKAESVKAAWEPVKPAFKANKEKFDPTVEFQKDGTIVMANRGMLLSRNEFPKGATVKCRWSWISEEPNVYPDQLAVALRTDGDRKRQWSFEIDDALVVRLNPHSTGSVFVQIYERGKDEVEIGRKQGIAFKMGDSHDIEITDLGDRITVRIDGKEVLEQKVDPSDGGGKKVAVYNREPVAGKRKVSTATDLTIKETEKK